MPSSRNSRNKKGRNSLALVYGNLKNKETLYLPFHSKTKRTAVLIKGPVQESPQLEWWDFEFKFSSFFYYQFVLHYAKVVKTPSPEEFYIVHLQVSLCRGIPYTIHTNWVSVMASITDNILSPISLRVFVLRVVLPMDTFVSRKGNLTNSSQCFTNFHCLSPYSLFSPHTLETQ